MEGRLGPTAKISDASDNHGVFVICIYCPNFDDKDEILRVRQAMNEAQICTWSKRPLYFKLDAFTVRI